MIDVLSFVNSIILDTSKMQSYQKHQPD